MSLPQLNFQRTFFDTEMMFPSLGKTPGAERFSFFAERILPELIKQRPELEKMYCADNGRPAEEPVRMLAVLILQFMERLPDRQTVEACNFDLRWKLALGMEADEQAFHPTSLVKFRDRLLDHGLERLGFEVVIERMRTAGYLPKHTRQRLDSTHIIGVVKQMSQLECVSQTLRLLLEELELVKSLVRPATWTLWWERYVESKVDYKSSGESLRQKMGQAGRDAWEVLGWVKGLDEVNQQRKAVQLLQSVFDANFEMSKDEAIEKRLAQPAGAIHNPHNPDAQWSSKSTTKDKEWIGHKVQVAETVLDQPRQMGEPTKSVITSIVTQNAIESDKAGMAAVLEEQQQLGLEKPETLYVDGAYVSGPGMAEAKAEDRELMGPAPASPDRGKVYTSEAFTVDVEERQAICPAGKVSTQCSRLVEQKTGKAQYRFEWSTHCSGCVLLTKCVGGAQRHRTLVVGEHHTLLQARRQAMRTEAFKKDMCHRNGIEGTQSELVRGYGLRRARYRGQRKVRLQNYLIGAACNIRRWCRRVTWEAQQAVNDVIATATEHLAASA